MTVEETAKLFTPAKVGNVELKHRVVLAPLTRLRADKTTAVPADFAAEYYAQRSSDGGLLVSEGTFIAEEAGGMSRVPGLYSQEQIAAWKAITDAVHAKGGYIFCQLWALGRVANPNVVPNIWSAGSKPFEAKGAASLPKLTTMTEADIDRFVGHYRQAALNAIEAGFDGVELHGANGYLIDQFLQTNSNDRTDSYGGSLENRFRFPLRVLNAVCDAIGPERVGIRMSPFSRFQGMREADPLSVFVPWAKAIVKAQPSLAFIHAVEPRIEGGSDSPDSHLKTDDTLSPVRDVVSSSNVKFIVAGGFTPETAVKHANQTDDLVGFGRYFIPPANPDLPARIKNGWPLTKSLSRQPFTRDAMCSILETIPHIYTGVQDFLDKSQRSWQAACAAWNEVPDAPTIRLPVQKAKVVISQKEWAIERARMGGCVSEGLHLELQAIDFALDYTIKLVEKKTENEKGRLQVLQVYTDCQAALLCLRKALRDLSALDTDNEDRRFKYKTIKSQVAQKIALEMGHKVVKLHEVGVYAEFHWVPRNKTIGNIHAHKGAGLARMGGGCDYTLNNALIEFQPADPAGEGDDNKTSVCLEHVYATVPQKHMAEEITSTLRERAATVKEILAEMAQDAAKEKEREAT
ncbi:hypothetical protein FAUST_4433 [Fusarium austroamericanum]|uniref:NADH:flavin oxidoreductase/NADH oxidase N-terminal domain-containing protein n=1 Tax=Fusarium austroamericanum TaxID=282268 RepID=A0AAN6C331_FUSAU|nr:hypothetical protein FAUST_4433 [Fusarium austroamericanum]